MSKEEKRVYDLEERTAQFGEDVIKFTKKILINKVTERLVPQLVASATSVGANYCEADNAESPKDFRHKIGICKKESRESKHFLRMTAVAINDQNLIAEARILWKEAMELNLIFNAIYRNSKKK